MIYDIIIVGAGTAGLTAAIYATRANKTVLVLESKTYGGQIITTSKIENYPGLPHISGVDFAKKLYNQAVELGAKIEFEEVEKIEETKEDDDVVDLLKKVTTDEEEYLAKTIILATGSNPKRLGLKDEERLSGKGISYCATCDGALYRDKTVAVIGGGNTAFYDALYLSEIAKKVYIIHRRSEFRADKVLIEKVKAKENVEFILDSLVSAINGEDHLTSLELTSTTNESNKTLDVAAAFVAVGRTPATENFKDLVELDDDGHVTSGEDCLTSKEGIFVAGDLRSKTLHQLVTAASDGAVAATAAINYLATLS